MDTIRRRIYPIATLGIRVTNYLLVMGVYHRFLWDKIHPLLNNLLEAKKVLTLTFHQEAIAFATQEMHAVHHVINCTTVNMTAAVAMRCNVLLLSAGTAVSGTT